MTKSYDLNKPKNEPKRKDTNKTKTKVKIKEEIESYEDMLKREKREKHGREGVHIT